MASRKYTVSMFVALSVLLPIIAFGLINYYQNRYERLPVLYANEQTLPQFSLTNQNGVTISIDNWKNKIVVVDFFFTHCLSVCPRMTANLKKVQQVFKHDDGISINSFSVDPQNDSAGRLREYINLFHIDASQWNFLTGEKKDIYRLARKSFLLAATDGDGGPNDFIHSDKLILLDTQKRIRGYYDGTSEAAIKDLLNDIKKLRDEN